MRAGNSKLLKINNKIHSVCMRLQNLTVLQCTIYLGAYAGGGGGGGGNDTYI